VFLLKNKQASPPFTHISVDGAEKLAAAIPLTGLCDGAACGHDSHCARKLASPGYCVAELVDPSGPRRKANTRGSEWLALDVDLAAIPAGLERYERVVIRTHSGRWHVLVRLERLASPDEYEATIAPWVTAGADKRARDVCRFLFAPVWGVTAHAGERMPVAAPSAAAAKRAARVAKPAPAAGGATPGLEAWDRTSLDQVLSDPAGTNEKAGHLGAMLAQHHWSEEDARAYCAVVLVGQNARHVESAVSAFRRVRNGEIRWNGAMRLQALGLRLLGESAIETARPLALRRNDKNAATPWYYYGGEGAWLAMSESEAEAIVHVVRPEINALPTAQRNRARAEHLRDHRRYNMPASDTDPCVLNVRNGLVDLRTGELRPHDPAHYCTRVAGARYDETIDTRAVEALMLDWCGDDAAMADYAWSLAGEAALGRGKRAFVVCYGPPGTGKSCLTQLVMTALGSYATSVSPTTWLKGTTESERQEQLSRTVGARLVASPELPGGRWDPVIKAFTSGGQDVVSIAGKWQRARDVRPTGLIWLTGNDVPEGADAAMRDRALFLPLTRTYDRNQRWADDVLPTYGQAALARIVRAAVDCYARGGPLPMPGRAADTRAEHMAEPFVQWLAEHEETGAQISGRELWLAWERSKAKNDAPTTETALGRRLREADLAVRYPKNKTNKGLVYVGLAV
jgi:P4 family phage/plasmid primase-like protien